MRFWGILEYGGETLIICSSTRSAIMIEYFSVHYNTVRLIANFRESPRATPVQSQFRIVFRQNLPDEAPDLSLIENTFV